MAELAAEHLLKLCLEIGRNGGESINTKLLELCRRSVSDQFAVPAEKSVVGDEELMCMM